MHLRTALATLVAGFFATGCMSVYSPAIGVLKTDVKGPIDAGTRVGKKHGEACAQTILGLVATGDASIETAAKNGRITRIESVDHRTENMIGIGKFCTIVHGS